MNVRNGEHYSVIVLMSNSFPAVLPDSKWTRDLNSFGRKGVERLPESQDGVSFKCDG